MRLPARSLPRRARVCLPLLTLALTVPRLFAQTEPARVTAITAITGATVIDGTGRVPVPDAVEVRTLAGAGHLTAILKQDECFAAIDGFLHASVEVK